jgi:hypothetical protein
LVFTHSKASTLGNSADVIDGNAGNDGNKGDSDDEVDDNSVDRTDDNNQVHTVVEIELETVQVPDSYVLSPFLNYWFHTIQGSERKALVHINRAFLDH